MRQAEIFSVRGEDEIFFVAGQPSGRPGPPNSQKGKSMHRAHRDVPKCINGRTKNVSGKEYGDALRAKRLDKIKTLLSDRCA